MVFSSIAMVFFLLPVAVIFYAIINKLTKGNNIILNIFLIILSLIFYWWGTDKRTVELLIIFIAVNYFIGYLLRTNKSKIVLTIGIIINILIMIHYKYPEMLLKAIGAYMNGTMDVINVIFPLGLSFIIFHSISYLIDTYKDEVEVEGKEINAVINFSLYILFFPKITEGPIVKYNEMRGELSKRKFEFNNICYGIERIIIGLAKKVLIADVFGNTIIEITLAGNIDQVTAWIGVILFSFQLYMDFSGYSDMAIGMARIFGFSFKENFDFPYFSTSISEFWRRWHTSLGRWFREYVYFPLGGSRKGNIYINIFIVFLLTGMWHGNTIIYVCWGVAHGLVNLLERTNTYKKLKEKIPFFNIIGWIYTTLVVWIGWLCFRLEGISDFILYIKNLLGFGSESVVFTWKYFINTKIIILLLITCILMVILYNKKVQEKLIKLNDNSVTFNSIKYLILIGIFILCFSEMVSNGFSPFLYFSY